MLGQPQLIQSPRLVPDGIEDLFGSPPLIFGERIEDFNDLKSRFVAWVEPQDIVDWVYMEEVVRCQWQIQRIRRLQSPLIDYRLETALVVAMRALDPLGSLTSVGLDGGDRKLAHEAVKGGESAQEKVTVRIADTGVAADLNSLCADAFSKSVPTVANMERLLASLETRRDKALKALGRRSMLAQRASEVSATKAATTTNTEDPEDS